MPFAGVAASPEKGAVGNAQTADTFSCFDDETELIAGAGQVDLQFWGTREFNFSDHVPIVDDFQYGSGDLLTADRGAESGIEILRQMVQQSCFDIDAEFDAVPAFRKTFQLEAAPAADGVVKRSEFAQAAFIYRRGGVAGKRKNGGDGVRRKLYR